MRHYAVLTLTVSALFLMFVGAFLNTRSLFYMSTVMIVTLLVLRAQAWLATRGLRFERVAPTTMVAGERVAMRIRVWSTLNIRRPLLFIVDELPPSLQHDADIRPLPVAPSREQAVETRYELNPLKRGVYSWSKIRVESTDSLGLINLQKMYQTEPFEITIHPAKISVAIDVASLSGWGANHSDEGRNRGYGIEPRGVREFVPGDSLRHVHWRSTARVGTLQVKEFETGFNTRLSIVMQLTEGTEAGEGAATTLEAMCGHAVYLADVMLQRGSVVDLPNLEPPRAETSASATHRIREINDALAVARSNRQTRFAGELEQIDRTLPNGSTVIVMVTAAEEGVSAAIRRIAARSYVLVLAYDPSPYAKDKVVADFLPATDPDFLAATAAPNVTLKLMPYPYAASEKAR